MDAFALLRLQIEWGADDALDDEPVVRLRETARPAPTTPALVQQRAEPRPAAEPPKASPAERALAAAAQANTLEELRAAIAAFDGCALRDTAGHLVFAEGDPSTGLLLIGEAPGAEEDRTGQVFAGPQGVLLDKMLASIHLTRADMLLTPLIPWRPPGGRPANASEIALCLPFLYRLIAITRPMRMVALGAAAAALLQAARRRRAQPDWIACPIQGTAETTPLLPLPGLTGLTKNPLDRREAWAGLRLLRRTLDAG